MESGLIPTGFEYCDHEGDLELLQKSKALDEYLGDVYGESWFAAKFLLNIQPHAVKQTKDLWKFFLVAVCATKSTSAIDQSVRTLPRSLTNPIRTLANFVDAESPISLAVVASHPAIAEDLSTAWHPAWQGVKVEAAQTVTAQELSKIEAALQLIQSSSVRAASLVGEVCAAICLLRANGRMDLGSCVSLTSKFIPGLIYFTPAPVIMTAESIV